MKENLMSDLFWLSRSQLRRIEPFFHLSHGVPRVDDQRVLSGIIHVIRNGLRWRDAPKEYGPHKTLYNRFVRWSRLGVFDRIFAEMTVENGEPAKRSGWHAVRSAIRKSKNTMMTKPCVWQ
jgi:putative transposase